MNAQTGIFALGDGAHGLFEFSSLEGANGVETIRAIANLHAVHTTVGGTNAVVGFRPDLWRMAGASIPDDVHAFDAPIAGPDGFAMPATQADAFLWFSAVNYDAVFDRGAEAVGALANLATLTREYHGWPYQHSRDLTGFEDGTENPTLYDAPGVALIESGPGEGGSVLLFQQWCHNTPAWLALGDAAQERVIGRTKPDSVEFSDDAMPPDSHVARTKFVEGGEERKIFRRNLPYGRVSDHGTLFIGFAAEQKRLQGMLVQMAGADGGPRDALTRFATPLTGAYYFCPSLDALAAFVSP